jgi:hypothetical protein
MREKEGGRERGKEGERKEGGVARAMGRRTPLPLRDVGFGAVASSV